MVLMAEMELMVKTVLMENLDFRGFLVKRVIRAMLVLREMMVPMVKTVKTVLPVRAAIWKKWTN